MALKERNPALETGLLKVTVSVPLPARNRKLLKLRTELVEPEKLANVAPLSEYGRLCEVALTVKVATLAPGENAFCGIRIRLACAGHENSNNTTYGLHFGVTILGAP